MNKAKAAVATLGALVLGAGVVACSSEENVEQAMPKEFGYILPEEIVTTNAGTALGVATDAVKLSARLYPGAFIAGPDQQLLPNPDLVTATRSPQDTKQVDYVINDKATYSDGKPVVCDDFLLTQTASAHTDLFGADMPLFSQVQSIDCTAGSKTFSVHFNNGFGDRYRELFSAGTVLPSHTVGEKAEIPDVVAAIRSGNTTQLAALGEAWQKTFTTAETDPSTVPTSGPYRISARGEEGDLVFDTNPEWKGVKPAQSPIHVWPNTVDIKKLVENNQVAVADLDLDEKPTELGLTEPDYVTTTLDSSRVDTLRVAPAGPLSTPAQRHAFNGCVDRNAIAEALKKFSGANVHPTGLRVVQPTHPLASQLQDINDTNSKVDIEGFKGLLQGATVRIGYLEATARYKIIVDSIAESCRAAGVTVEGVPVTPENFGTLGVDYDMMLDTRSSFGRNSTTNANVGSQLKDIRAAEAQLATEAITIPLVTEPRTIAVEEHVHNVIDNAGDGGVSWNMDRWDEQAATIHEDQPSQQPSDSPTQPSSPPPGAGNPA